MRTGPIRTRSTMEFEPGTSQIRATNAKHCTCTPRQILWKFGRRALFTEGPYLITFSYLCPVLRNGAFVIPRLAHVPLIPSVKGMSFFD
jgi:hypothetical protein